MKICFFLLLLALTLPGRADDPLPGATPKPRTEAALAAETVVVFNQNDINSVALAGFYADARHIPTANLVGLKCPQSEEISREDYDRYLAEPLRKVFVERGWWTLRDQPASDGGRIEATKIRFVVLIRGIPLKIAQAVNYDGDSAEGEPAVVYSRNEAAVDSELSILGTYTKQISGPLKNPYYREEKNIEETDVGNPLLVCRLDAAELETVRSMISDSVAAEKDGLRGFVYVDAQGLKSSGLVLGDEWLFDAARDAREHGLPVVLDNGPAVFPLGYPLQHCALYLGWYTEDVAGAFATPGFHLQRGAVAYHIHSFSAISLRHPNKNWCAPLLAAGAAATLGNVYEPFLGLLPRPNVFEQRLREGFTFAEAAYMSQQYLSWMTTFIGDPLYRPFMNSAATKPKPGDPWDAYRAGVGIWIGQGRPAGESALKASAAQIKDGSLSEALGLLELSGNDNAKAMAAFAEARATYADPGDRIRVAIHEAGCVRTTKGLDAAVKFLQAQAAALPDARILQQLADNLVAEAKAGAKATEKKLEAPKTPAGAAPAVPEKKPAKAKPAGKAK